MTEVYVRRPGGGQMRAGSISGDLKWARRVKATPLQKARYLEDRDGRKRGCEFAYARMKSHDDGSPQALFWHAVWRLLR